MSFLTFNLIVNILGLVFVVLNFWLAVFYSRKRRLETKMQTLAVQITRDLANSALNNSEKRHKAIKHVLNSLSPSDRRVVSIDEVEMLVEKVWHFLVKPGL